MADLNKQIGERIRALREQRGWIQRDLAETADLPVRTIGRIERGEVDVRISTLEKVARALGTSASHLLK